MTPARASDEVLPARAVPVARRAISDHPEGFWTRAPGAPLDVREDIVLVSRWSRQRRSSHAWARAREMEPPIG